MAKGLTYTQRTLRYLREQGRIIGKVERWNAYAGEHGVRQDLFGFIDLIALDPVKGIVAIQCTGPHGHSLHRRKILAEEKALAWLRCGGRVELWSWRKVLVKRGGKARRWQPRIEEITEALFD